MILILEDDADREAYSRGEVAFDPDRLPPEEFRQPVTVWISPEAYAKEVVVGDEYHTMDELYEYRMLYNAAFANMLTLDYNHLVTKSWKHSDGEDCFGGGWFIVTMQLPEGQVSNHYEAEHWDLFKVREVETAPVWDGHTPADAAERLRAFCLEFG